MLVHDLGFEREWITGLDQQSLPGLIHEFESQLEGFGLTNPGLFTRGMR